MRGSPAGTDAGGTRHGRRLRARSEHSPTSPATALSVGLKNATVLSRTQKHRTALGLAHKLDVGAKRLVDGVTDPTLSSGVFYASAANTLKGPLVDQTDIFPDLANATFQDHANEAIHRFIS